MRDQEFERERALSNRLSFISLPDLERLSDGTNTQDHSFSINSLLNDQFLIQQANVNQGQSGIEQTGVKYRGRVQEVPKQNPKGGVQSISRKAGTLKGRGNWDRLQNNNQTDQNNSELRLRTDKERN